MATYKVRRVKPIMVSVTVEAVDEDRAIIYAQGMFADDARDDDAYEATRQPFGPDDTGDTRSETRSEWNEGDTQDDAAEAFRWGFTPDGREPEEVGREQ